MPKVTSRKPRRKPGSVENPSTPAELDNGITPPPDLGRQVDLGRPVCFPPALVKQRPPASVYEVFAFMDAECERFSEIHDGPVKGTWTSTKTIGEEIGMGESTARVAIEWLESRKWMRTQEILVAGRPAIMKWCMWRFPAPFAGGEFVLALDFAIKVEGDEEIGAIVPPKPRAEDGPFPRLLPLATRAPIPAQESAPKGSNGLKNTRTTTDGGKSVVVVRASPGVDGEETPSEPPPPPAEIDPRIVELLDQVEPGDRPDLDRALPAMLIAHTVERVVNSLLLGIARRKAGKILGTLAGYVEGIARKRAEQGPEPANYRGPGMLAGRVEPPRQPSADQTSAARASRRDELAIAADRERRYDALPAEDRARIEADFDAAEQPPPGVHPRAWKLARRLGCIALMEARS